MRRLAAVIVLAGISALSACGGDDDGGGGGGGTTLNVTGTIPVTVAEAISVSFDATCAEPTTFAPVGANAIVIAASSFTNACQVLQQNQDKQNSSGALFGIFRFNLAGATPLPITPGSYTIGERLDGTTFDVVFGGIGRTDATCTLTDSDATGGTITLSEVTASRVRGSVNVALSNGGSVSGNFDAPGCAYNLSDSDVCSLDLEPSTSTCVP